MVDQSALDLRYFMDGHVYNCPFCNRRNVLYKVVNHVSFDWTAEKICHVWFVKCSSCDKTSMHLSYIDISPPTTFMAFRSDLDLDANIFYSVPTAFFVIDERIPRVLRELITEADGCLKMNFLTGASACTRKAIYELTVRENAEGSSYEERIKYLKGKYSAVDAELFDILCHIKDMTSDKLHEQSWEKWDARHITLFLETLKVILHELYVIPDERRQRSRSISELLPQVLRPREAQRQDRRGGDDEAQ